MISAVTMPQTGVNVHSGVSTKRPLVDGLCPGDGAAGRDIVTAPRLTGWLLAILAMTSTGCATMNGAATPADVDAAVRARTAAGLRGDAETPLAPGVNLDDGVTQEEAVEVALWNSPSFQATLPDLGIARAGCDVQRPRLRMMGQRVGAR
jgi:hypothetical protein